MTPEADPQGMRLFNAAVAAFKPFEEFGFHIEEPRFLGGRGATVIARNGSTSIEVDGDWYESQMTVAVKVPGAKPILVERLIPGLTATTRKVPRGAKRGVLQSRLEQVAVAIGRHAPEVLAGGPDALARVLRAGGERE